jgi:DHA3 family tetracycline resistance protein-like MFS transporter
VGRLDPVRVWLLLRGWLSLTDAAWVVYPVFFVRTLHMTPLQLILVGTFMELAIFVFEVPTGIVADVYSRRLSIVIGLAVMGGASVGVALSQAPWQAIAAWAVWGFGYTFTSGATDAWLADEVGVENVRPAYLRGAQVGRAAALLGIGGSVALALVSLRLPILLAGALVAGLGATLAVVMPETGFRPAPREEAESAVRTMARTGKAGALLVRATPVLLLIMAISAFAGAWSEGWDRLNEAHLLRDVGLPSFLGTGSVVWFGVIAVCGIALSIAVARPANRRLESASRRTVTRVLFGLDLVLMGGAAFFALAGSFALAFVAMMIVGVSRSLAGPLFSSWLNQSIEDSSVRATVFSITSQADAIGQWTGGPAIGVIGNAFGIRVALLAGTFLLSPALWLYAHAARHGGGEPELERLPVTAAS